MPAFVQFNCKSKILLILLLGLIYLIPNSSFGQTSGKISGKVLDVDGSPLIGANIIIDGTSLGAAADYDGYYSIMNVRVGTYTIRARYIGYQTKIIQKVKVNADQTTKLDIELSSSVLQGNEVVIVAKKPIVEFSQTSSVSSVGKEEIENLPVQGLNEIVNLQAGVVDGHFRGGRIGEVQFQVDGVTVNNPYNNSSSLELDRSVLQEVQVISGTFDAKYGQAMSGVVNAILKAGSDKFEFSAEAFGGDYYTTESARYPNNSDFNPIGIQNYQLTISGPTYLPQTTFFISGRRFVNEGWLFGHRRFNTTDKSNFETRQFNPTGDNEKVSMSNSSEWSGQFKITNQSVEGMQFSYQATLGENKRKNYDHGFRLNPDGIKENKTVSFTHGFGFTHTLNEKMFYKLNVRQNYFDYKDYKYEDVLDQRYFAAGTPQGDDNYEEGALVQGVDLGRWVQKTNSLVFKGDYNWQITRKDLIEIGFEGQASEMTFGSPGTLVQTTVDGVQTLQARFDYSPIERYNPFQFSTYIQDRIEWGAFVIRAGVRLEYFDAQALVPSDLQNPANAISGSPLSHDQETSIKTAVAPRLGFSFPLTESSSIYFSYGHFYQMPGLGLLYSNADYSVLANLQEGGISYGIMGNPDLKPELTVQYEFGYKQSISTYFGAELSFFYKDIRDLLGVEFVSTYAAADYARYTNIDFGSVSGFTLSLTHRDLSPLSVTLDYTMQFAQGNSSDPQETANRASSGKDSRPRDVPFGWDQRHTLNLTAIWYESKDYSLGAIVRFGSGQPYTPEIGTTAFGADLETNSGIKNSYVLVDLRAEKYFEIAGINLSVFTRVFNLLNTRYVNGFVFTSTGSPDYSLTPAANKVQLTNPSRYYEPRRIEFGISIRSN
ncbi:MAG: TonB-dependent receptor [bacterium]